MQTKNKNQIFLSDGLEDIIDLDNLSKDTSAYLTIELNGKKLPVLSLKETAVERKLTIMIDEKDLQSLFSKQQKIASIKLGQKTLSNYDLSKDLVSFKIKKGFKNIYNAKLTFTKKEKIDKEN
jgi:bifunctional DNase/RNase